MATAASTAVRMAPVNVSWIACAGPNGHGIHRSTAVSLAPAKIHGTVTSRSAQSANSKRSHSRPHSCCAVPLVGIGEPK